MSINPLRKILWTIGFDFHRYRPEPDQLSWLKKHNIKSIIDVGANTGQFAEEIRPFLPDAFIYSFEPLKDCFNSLAENLKSDNKFKAYNVALGDTNEEVVMQHNKYSPSSSILKMAQTHKDIYPHTKETFDEKITVKRLDDFGELNNIEKEILVKIDTQGFEDRVIRGGQKFLKNVKVVIVETSFVTLYEKQLLFGDIYSMLTNLGFTYKGPLHRKFNSKDGGNLAEDSIFVR